jgi:hypothetical protein
LLDTSEEEINGNAAAPSAAATPSFRKLRRAGSLLVIEVSPFFAVAEALDELAARVSMGKRLLVNRGFWRG